MKMECVSWWDRMCEISEEIGGMIESEKTKRGDETRDRDERCDVSRVRGV